MSEHAGHAEHPGDRVRVEDLSVAYRSAGSDLTVVDGVSFDVAAGSTTALVGESGSGKTTIAGSLLGHLRHGSRITSGRVVVDGQDVFGLDPSALRRLRSTTVAMVPQNAGHALTPSMRVGRQLEETLRSTGADRTVARRRTIEAFDQVSLPRPAEIARRYPHELSGGQQQRVAIAMAVAVEPQVLVLDEPTTGLDVITQRGVLAVLRTLTRELGTATLMVSHDFGVVAALADHAAVLREGRTVESAAVHDLFNEPRDAYTRHLLSTVPRIDGTAAGMPAGAQGEDVGETIVRADDVRIGYGRRGGTLAVRGASLRLRRGEVVALVGESGSGKSTLAWSLAGLHVPDGGTMRYVADGADVGDGDLARRAGARPRGLRRRVQLVFQNADTSLNPRRSVADAVRRPLTLFGLVPKEELATRVDEVVRDVHLEPELVGRLPAQLSGGQRQRVGIARALAGSPSVVVADEITTALDVSVQASILDLLDELRREHDLACLFISHDLAVVHHVADRVAVMHDGVLVEEGATSAVFDGPNHPYTRELLDATLEPDPAAARASIDTAGDGGDLAKLLAGGRLAGLVDQPDDIPVEWRWRDAGAEMTDLGGGHRVRPWKLAGVRP